MRLRRTARRSGFTLVELMVAAALTILIMAVLATGFQVGLQSLSHLKSAGDLADRLRTAETLLRYDLDAPHFDEGIAAAGSAQSNTSSNPGTLRLSDLRLDLDATLRPAGGFVQIRQPALPALGTYVEGIDQDSLSSTRATEHGISFTVRRTGKTPGELFAAVDAGVGPILLQPANQMDVAVVGGTFVSDWAEVHWFLDTSRPILVNGVTTFPLCRRVRLLTKAPVGGVLPATPLAEVVSADPAGNTNTLAAIANPVNRLAPAALTNASARFGDDIVITNVTSFEVKPTWQPASGGASPRTSLGVTALLLNADFPFDEMPAGPGFAANNMQQSKVFDTALGGVQTGAVVTPLRITGVQIKIRVYDSKNKLTRQSVVTSKL